MAQLEEIIGQVPTSVQPKDNPSPVPLVEQPELPMLEMQQQQQPSMSVAEEPSTVEPMQPQQSQPNTFAPTEEAPSKDDIDFEKQMELALSSLAETDSKNSEKASKQQADDFEKQMNEALSGLPAESDENQTFKGYVGVVEPRLMNESFWQSISRGSMENLKYITTRMRAEMENAPEKEADIFRSVFGQENVREKNGRFQFKFGEGRDWQDINSSSGSGLQDAVLYHSLSMLPTALNVLTQVGATAGATALGGPLAGAAGYVASGAPAGAVEAVSREGIKSGLDALLGISPERAPLVDEVMKDAGISAFMTTTLPGLGAGGIAAAQFGKKLGYKLPLVKSGLEKIDSAIAFNVAPYAKKKMGQLMAGFREFSEAFFPESVGKSSADISKGVTSAIDVAQERFGKEVGLYKEEAVSRAGNTLKSQSDNTLRSLTEELERAGYKADPNTGLMSLPENANRSLANPEVNKTLDLLADTHNRIIEANKTEGGTSLERLFNDLDQLKSRVQYEKDNKTGSQYLLSKLDGSIRADRDLLMKDALKGTEAEASFEKAFNGYYSSVRATSYLKSKFNNPEDLKYLVDDFTRYSPADKSELIDHIVSSIGNGKEFEAFKGAYYNNMLEKHSKDGVINSGNLLKFMNDPGNAKFIDKIFSKQERTVLNRMAVEGKQIANDIKVSRERMRKFMGGMEIGMWFFNQPLAAAMATFRLLGSNKRAINYMIDEGFIDLARKASGPQLKANILKAKELAEGMIEKMAIVDVPLKTQSGAVKTIQRYAPLVSGSATPTIREELVD